MKLSFSLCLFALMAFTFSACMDTEDPYDGFAQLQKDKEAIDKYLTQQGITDVEEDVNGVHMVIHQLGTGLPAASFNTIIADYDGKIMGSTTSFDDGTYDGPIGQVIPGWQIAFQSMPVGTVATIYIPSPLAYADKGQGTIPGNAILKFDVDFKEIKLTESERTRFKTDTTTIWNYIKANLNGIVKDPSGIRYRITTPLAEGLMPGLYDKVKVKLSFKLFTDDTKTAISVTREPSASFYSRVADQYIPGLAAVLPKMKEGEKATLYVPSGLAFGPNPIIDGGAQVIPANSPVIIEVELLDVVL